MATRRLSGIASSSSVPDNGGDHSGGGGGSAGGYVDDVFSAYVYEGTGAAQDIENGIDLAGEGGMVWIKDRQNARDHALFDTERGTDRYLNSNQNYVESQGGTLTSYNQNGFSLFGNAAVNGSGIDYVSWTFRKAPKFFDVVTWTGTGTPQTIPHNLGAVPGMIIVKSLDHVVDWCVYHKDLASPNREYLHLNSNSSANFNTGVWNDTAPTSTEFTVGSHGFVNGSGGGDYVAYLFAHDESDESMIKCGSYEAKTGNVVELGFEPQWILTKASASNGSWYMYDTMRGWGADQGSNDNILWAESSNAEYSHSNSHGITPTGFTSFNDGGRTYIYIAIRRPNKPAEEFEPEELFAVHASTGTSTDKKINTGFPVDLGIFSRRTGSTIGKVFDRLRGGNKQLATSDSTTEYTANGSVQFDDNLGITVAGNMSGVNNSGTPLIDFYWRRAPCLFDVVTYTGDGQAGREIAHNLGVAPEMIWFKGRDQNRNWAVYAKPAGYIETGQLNMVGKFEASGVLDSTPTNDSIVLGNSGNSNWSGWSYIAYLFASVPGISKVGSYTGTGAELDIDCGFTSGARFVLIKRTDANGDWYVWDSVRGITVGNDPYILLNAWDAEVTNTDYIDPLSSGFKVTASAPDAINAANGEYIFYAIA